MEHDTKMNIKLRSEILEVALILENEVTRLLISCLSVEKENTKAISHKSSSLSFKNKIDLLFDLDFLTKEQHIRFLLLMEFRNQFMHNIHCTSFEKAVELLGSEKGNALLKFDDLDFEAEKEFRYAHSFRTLFLYFLDEVAKIYESRENAAKKRRDAFISLMDYSKTVIDDDTKLLGEILEECLAFEEDSNDLLKFKEKITGLIDQRHDGRQLERSKEISIEMRALFDSKEFKKVIRGV